MPMVIAFIPAIAAAAGAVGLTLAAITIASAVASGIYAAGQQRKARRAATDAYNAALQDRTQMVRGTIEGRDIVLGRVRKSGQIAFIGSCGAKKEKLVIVLAMAGHEIDAFETWYANDIQLTLDGNGYVQAAPYLTSARAPLSATVTATAAGTATLTLPSAPITGSVRVVIQVQPGGGGYNRILDVVTTNFTVSGNTVTVTDGNIQPGVVVIAGYENSVGTSWARIRTYAGTDTQTSDSRLQTLFPGQWTANHRLRGIAYAIIELDFNDDVYTAGIPNFSCIVRGAKCFDPRTGTTAWSQNPAILLRYLATSALGGRLLASSVNDTSIIAAANVCDINVTYNVVKNGATVVENRPQFRGAYTFKSGSRPKDGLDELATAMAGKWCFQGNQLYVRAGAYTSPVLTLGDDDFGDASEMQVQPSRPRDQVANVITAVCIDDENDYRVVDMPRVEAAAYIASDGAELPLETEFSAIAYVPQAQHVSRIMLRDARQALTVIACFKLSAYRVQVLDVIALNNTRYGWTAKAFEVLSRRWTLEGLIELTLKETAAAIFTPDASFSAVDFAPNTNLPTPWLVPPITGLTITSNTSLQDGSPQTRVRAAWTLSTSEAVLQGGQIEVAYVRIDQMTGQIDWQSALVSGSATELMIPGLQQGFAYAFRIRAMTTLARSLWSALSVAVIASAPLDWNGITNIPYSSILNNDDSVALGFALDPWPVGQAFPGNWLAWSGRNPTRETTITRVGNTAARYNGLVTSSSDGMQWLADLDDTPLPAGTFLSGAIDMYLVSRTAGLPGLLVRLYTNALQTLYVDTTVPAANATVGQWQRVAWSARVGPTQPIYGIRIYVIGSLASSPLAFAGSVIFANLLFALYDNSTDNRTVTLAANGSLSGAGGGQVTITGLGYTGALNATADLRLVGRNNVVVSGNRATRVAGGGWDADCYSIDAYTGGAFASCSPGQTDVSIMFGLNSDPTSNAHFNTLDYAFHFSSAGILQIYESGAYLGNYGGHLTDRVYTITYDGAAVRYMENGTVIRTVAAPAGLQFFFDSSFNDVGSINSIRFGPMSPVTNIGTAQLQVGAATDVIVATVASLTVTGESGTGTSYLSTSRWTPVGSISFIATETGSVVLHFNSRAVFTGTPTIYPDKLACQVKVNVDFNNNDTEAAGEDLVVDGSYAPGTGSITLTKQVSASRRRPVVAGTTYTWNFYAQKLEGSLTLQEIELRAEIIKR